jgi:transcriptional regulator with XRE-family HTH domain
MDVKLAGKIIRYHRKVAGLSRIQLAELAGIGKTSVFDIENGKESVRLNTLFSVIKALNISMELQSPLMTKFYEGENS